MTAWPSAKGLSVYNVLKLGGDMSRESVLAYLRAHWDPETTQDYVDGGLMFLGFKGWAEQSDGQIRLLTRGRSAAKTEDETDLILVVGGK